MRIVDIRETRDPAQIATPQFQHRFLRDDDLGGGGDHRRDARRQAGRGLRLQLHRPLRLRRADARALHPAHPRRRARRRCSTTAATISIRKRSSPCMLQREKSGGHSERSIGIGTIEVAVWDAVAKIAGKPLHRLLAERYNGGKVAAKVFCYVGGGWYLPGQTIKDLQDEMRRHLDAGYTMVKMKVGGAPLAEDVRRVEAVQEHPAVGRRARGRRQLASSSATRRSPTPRRSRRSSCAGSRSRAIRSTTRCSPRSPRPTRRRSRPARTCSRRRTSRTSCASAACAPSAAT